MQQQKFDRQEVDSGLDINFPQTFATESSERVRLTIIRDAIINEAQQFVGILSPLTEINAPRGSEREIPLKILDSFTIVLEDSPSPELVTVLLLQSRTQNGQIVPHITPHNRADLQGVRLAQHLERYLKDQFGAALGRYEIADESDLRRDRREKLLIRGALGLVATVALGSTFIMSLNAANAPTLENSGLISTSGNIDLQRLTPEKVFLIQGKEIRFEAVVQQIENEPARVSRDGTVSLHRYKLISPSSGQVLPVKPIWYGRGLDSQARYQINGYVRDSTMPLFMEHVFFEKVR